MAICHTLTSTFSCVNYTLNSFGFLVQKTLFRVINFLIYKEWKRGENTVRNVCVPGQDFVQILVLGFSPAHGSNWVDHGEAWGACLAELLLRGPGCTVCRAPVPDGEAVAHKVTRSA